MSELAALREIEAIRRKRVSDAEDALRRAQQALRQSEQALEEARLALARYLQALPGLIEQLFADCIGHLVSREFVQDKTYEETQLRAKVEDYKARVVEAEHALAVAQHAVQTASAHLVQAELKLEAVQALVKDARKRAAVAQARADGRVLDELATARFVRAERKP